MISELKIVLTFYLTVQTIAFLAAPVGFFVFKNLKDRGYAFSKLTGVLFLAYVNLLMTAIGFAKHRLALNLFILTSLGAVSLFCAVRKRGEIGEFFRTRRKTIAVEEILFSLCFVMAVLIKMGDASMTGAEKFPDFAFYNRLIIENAFPPTDIWLSGLPVNYYYIGHFIFSSLANITGISPDFGVNLSVILVFCLIFIFSFSIAYNFTNKHRVGILSALAVAFLGNLDSAVQVFMTGIKNFNWWHSTHEVMTGTINEFPFFSFLLGDLHAHYISLPVFLLLLAVVQDIFESDQKIGFKSLLDYQSGFFFKTIALSIVLGFLLATNPWYGPPGLALIFIALSKGGDWHRESLASKLLPAIILSAVITVLASALFSRFILHFSPPVSGIGIVPLRLASGPGEFFVIFSFPFIFAIFYLVLGGAIKNCLKQFAMFILGAALFSALVFIVRPNLVTIILILASAAFLYSVIKNKMQDLFPVLIMICFLILLGCEIFYLADNYGPKLLRMNTVFKFHYIAFAILMMSTPVALVRTLDNLKKSAPRKLLLLAFAILFLSSGVYAVLGSAVRNFSNFKQRAFTLDGLKFLKDSHPGEYEAIKWLKQATNKNSVILEATGTPYSYYARFSTFSGRPTVLGWANHESVWRKNIYPLIDERAKDIGQIYSAKNKKDVIPLLKKYGVEYIIVGYLERKDFGGQSPDAFARIADKVFKNSEVTIYRLSRFKGGII